MSPRPVRSVSSLLGAVLCLLLVGAGKADDFRTLDRRPSDPRAFDPRAGDPRADDARADNERASDLHTARVSDLRGSLTVRGEGEDPSFVDLNAIIREGDTLWTDESGQAEVELERGSWIRLAEDTKLEIRHLPPDAEFQLWTGSVYIDVPSEVEGATRLRTPTGDVDVLPDSVVRVDLSKGESARVSVFSGRAEVAPERGESLRLAAGERIYLEDERPAADPERFDRQDQDGFDRYQKDRVDYFIRRPLPRELDRDVIGARELGDYGSWVDVEGDRYWRPRAEPDWRPYSAGYWSYVPACGYSWVDYAPWGYTTCHYGRWTYRPTFGWLWAPGRVWAPAYVSWASHGDYCAWAPLDPWDRPCRFPGSSSGFECAFGGGGFFVDYHTWSFCPRDDFFYCRHHRDIWGGGHRFYRGNEINITVNNFRVVRDVHREYGVPREHVRGLTVGRGGRAARESVLRVENRMPERRLQLIQNRFHEDGHRDRVLASRPNAVERVQRSRDVHVDNAQILKGDQTPAVLSRRTPQVRTTADRVDFRTGERAAVQNGRDTGSRTRRDRTTGLDNGRDNNGRDPNGRNAADRGPNGRDRNGADDPSHRTSIGARNSGNDRTNGNPVNGTRNGGTDRNGNDRNGRDDGYRRGAGDRTNNGDRGANGDRNSGNDRKTGTDRTGGNDRTYGNRGTASARTGNDRTGSDRGGRDDQYRRGNGDRTNSGDRSNANDRNRSGGSDRGSANRGTANDRANGNRDNGNRTNRGRDDSPPKNKDKDKDKDKDQDKDRHSSAFPGAGGSDRVMTSAGAFGGERGDRSDRGSDFQRGTLLPGSGLGNDRPADRVSAGPSGDRSLDRDRYRRSAPDSGPVYRDFRGPSVTPATPPAPAAVSVGDRGSYRRDASPGYRQSAPDSLRSAPSYGGRSSGPAAGSYRSGDGGRTSGQPSRTTDSRGNDTRGNRSGTNGGTTYGGYGPGYRGSR